MSLNLIMATAGKDMLGLTFITEEQQACYLTRPYAK